MRILTASLATETNTFSPIPTDRRSFETTFYAGRSRPLAPRRRAARINSRSHDGQGSLVAGKNAGNFAESALFCKHPSRKHQLIQVFTDEFPTPTEQGIFLPAQGINSPSRE
jgi:Metallopeptidase family M81